MSIGLEPCISDAGSRHRSHNCAEVCSLLKAKLTSACETLCPIHEGFTGT
jgi:hypothetical protein